MSVSDKYAKTVYLDKLKTAHTHCVHPSLV